MYLKHNNFSKDTGYPTENSGKLIIIVRNNLSNIKQYSLLLYNIILLYGVRCVINQYNPVSPVYPIEYYHI